MTAISQLSRTNGRTRALCHGVSCAVHAWCSTREVSYRGLINRQDSYTVVTVVVVLGDST